MRRRIESGMLRTAGWTPRAFEWEKIGGEREWVNASEAVEGEVCEMSSIW